jgi:hypothetical protein
MSTYLRQALSLTDQCEGFEKFEALYEIGTACKNSEEACIVYKRALDHYFENLYPSQQACNIVACLIGYGKSRPHLAFDLTKKVDIHCKVVIFSHLIAHHVYETEYVLKCIEEIKTMPSFVFTNLARIAAFKAGQNFREGLAFARQYTTFLRIYLESHVALTTLKKNASHRDACTLVKTICEEARFYSPSERLNLFKILRKIFEICPSLFADKERWLTKDEYRFFIPFLSLDELQSTFAYIPTFLESSFFEEILPEFIETPHVKELAYFCRAPYTRTHALLSLADRSSNPEFQIKTVNEALLICACSDLRLMAMKILARINPSLVKQILLKDSVDHLLFYANVMRDSQTKPNTSLKYYKKAGEVGGTRPELVIKVALAVCDFHYFYFKQVVNAVPALKDAIYAEAVSLVVPKKWVQALAITKSIKNPTHQIRALLALYKQRVHK